MNSDLGRINTLASKLADALPRLLAVPTASGQHMAVVHLGNALSEIRGQGTETGEYVIRSVSDLLEALQPLVGGAE